MLNRWPDSEALIKHQVCRVYSLTKGEQLLAVSFTSPLTCLAVDALESTVYVGCQSGAISHFSLRSPPREVSVTAESLTATIIEGHTSSVTVLSLSMDGRTLASGAEGSNTKVLMAETKSRLHLRLVC